MVFFDFNIPFLESSSQNAESSKSAKKNARLKLVVKAMELGYSGVAYNRTIKGVMSESDRCQIPLFPLSSLLKAAPALSSTVRFHRELLGVRLDSPFRQYTRLTVAVETAIHASALNSGNPILKTYDLVAVRPLNQAAFDQACKVSAVDLISIDFSQKLPFRLKFPMVKAAIERGIHFEVTYSHLISDVKARSQILSGAQLLVDWTRGKNIIIASAAPTANELRGPYDVANLSSLLGLSMERAKAAVSKNCRSLIANALRKKQYHKETVRIEQISNDDLLNSKGDWFGNWHGWDPISSGEGDLSLEDIGKFLSAAHKTPKNSNGTDVMLVADGMPTGCLQSKDQFPISGLRSLSLDTAPFFFGSMQLESPATIEKSLKQSDAVDVVSDVVGKPLTDTSPKGPISHSEGDLMSPNTYGLTLTGTPLKDQISHSEGYQMQLEDSATCIPTIQNFEPSYECDQGPSNSNGVDFLPVVLNNTFESTESDNCLAGSEDNLLSVDDSSTLLSPAEDIDHCVSYHEDLKQPNGHDMLSISMGTPSYVTSSLNESLTMSRDANVMVVCEDHNENPRCLDMPDLSECDIRMEGNLTETEKREQCDLTAILKIELQERGDDKVPLVDDTISEEASDEMREPEEGDVVRVADDFLLEEVVEIKARKQEAGAQHQNEVLLHKGRRVKGKYKQKSFHAAKRRPFFCMLKPVLFKRKISRQKKMRALQ
ncbi:hypothetical protein CKAN_00533700 [Cinnamomum micranthum f. kanehirae]|uniref:Uncharacterized protein n=1 Tax=Cinnamomum micranthum f. kanehirae TaxID=337451 RepID=A0A443NEC1_9MAGN|nr:hypothetical protein CKAN_00533700 [Cinnamomum micranthum f. kanehirae]